ncbi:hypothetical protein L1281_000136 [Neisseria sp. HSC-16F19]|nr:hypothetical protein [Neisseria sp. HSC-16F19]MCP2039571.1 hypothetical protein [Neisseria sp. HSC-16F19]
MQKTTYQAIRHLLPQNFEHYQRLEGRYFLLHEGDLHLKQTLELDFDKVNKLAGLPPENEEYCAAIIVTGSLYANNIYNGQTDGAVDLLVSGNLTARNIVVGGQHIYVAGNLTVQDFYWGHYNHGELSVEGNISIRFFMATDYRYDRRRFRIEEDVDIQYALYEDAVEEEIAEAVVLKNLVQPQLLADPNDIEEFWSWSVWPNDTFFQTVLAGKTVLLPPEQVKLAPILLRAYESVLAQAPFLFADTQMSLTNLHRFTQDPEFPMLASRYDDDSRRFEYWHDDIYRRISHKDQRIVVYFERKDDTALLGEEENGEFTVAFRQLDSTDWYYTNTEDAPQEYAFFQQQWMLLQQEYSGFVHFRHHFLEKVSIAKFEELLALPVVKQQYSDYYAEDSQLYTCGMFDYCFRQESEDESALIQVWYDRSDESKLLHFQVKRGCVRIYTQDGDDPDSYAEVEFNEVKQYQRAITAFEILYASLTRK